MSDFSNYIRVAIQGLPDNTPLARASAYEKVRKVIRRQLEARSAGEAEINTTMEDLENAILDLEAEQLMVAPGAPKPAAPEPAPTPPAPAFDSESNVTPIVRKTADHASRDMATPSSAAEHSSAGAAASRPEKRSEAQAAPRFTDAPADNPPAPPKYQPQRPAASAASAERALKVDTEIGDPLEEFQSALTAELALPITPEETRADEWRPNAEAKPDMPAADPQETAPPAAVEPPPPPIPDPEPEPRELPGEAGFDVKILLRKAVNSEDLRDPATREIIYRRARNALIRYLKSLSPQPDFDTVHAHIERLNAAIREVEAEQAEKSFGNDNADTGPSTDELMTELEDIWSADFEQAVAEEPAPPRRPEPARPSTGDLERTIADEVEDAMQEIADSDYGESAQEAAPAPAPAARSIDDEVEEAVQDLIAADTARHQISKSSAPKKAARRRPPPATAPEPAPFEDIFDDDDVDPTTAENDRWATDDSFELPEDMFADEFADDEPAVPAAAAQKPRAAEKQRRRRGGFGWILALLLVLIAGGVVAGAVVFPDATARYTAKARTTGNWVLEFVAGLAGEPTRPVADEGEAAASADAPAADQEATADTARSGDGTEEAASSAGETNAAPESEAAPEPPATQTAVAPINGERAFLFATSGGQPVVNGNVAWSVIESSPQPGAPAEPAIRGEVAIPDDGLRATLTLRRNLDRTLPASHLFELVFVPAGGVAGSEIASVEGVAFVQSAQDRSEPLVGSVVKIADNIFLFALADVPAARELHDTLLRNPDLIEIRFVYYSGRQSTLRLVTGETGGAVFAEAMDAWAGETGAATAEPAAEPTPEPQPQTLAEPETVPLVTPDDPLAEPVDAAVATDAEETPAAAEPGRPVIPDNVPIPPDRPLFDG